MKLSEEQVFWIYVGIIILLGITVLAWYIVPDYIAWLQMPVGPNF